MNQRTYQLVALLAALLALLSLTVPLNAVMIAWDAPTEGGVPTGYNGYWGSESGNYTFVVDMGLVLTYDLPISPGDYFAVTAYNDEGESGFSNEVQYALEGPPLIGSTIAYVTEVCDLPPTGSKRLGQDYDCITGLGETLCIYHQLSAGDILRVGY